MDEPPGARLSTAGVSLYGKAISALRRFTNTTLNKEPSWRHTRPELTTGYRPNRY
jgi:hydrogenase small subunit